MPRGAQTIVRAIAEIGHGMGIVTTAEGVETAAQLRNVHAAGYTEAQGYLIARPMPASRCASCSHGEDDRMPFAPMAAAPAGGLARQNKRADPKARPALLVRPSPQRCTKSTMMMISQIGTPSSQSPIPRSMSYPPDQKRPKTSANTVSSSR